MRMHTYIYEEQLINSWHHLRPISSWVNVRLDYFPLVRLLRKEAG